MYYEYKYINYNLCYNLHYNYFYIREQYSNLATDFILFFLNIYFIILETMDKQKFAEISSFGVIDILSNYILVVLTKYSSARHIP